MEDTENTQSMETLQTRYSQACAHLGELIYKGILILKEITSVDQQAGEMKKNNLSKVPTPKAGEAS